MSNNKNLRARIVRVFLCSLIIDLSSYSNPKTVGTSITVDLNSFETEWMREQVLEALEELFHFEILDAVTFWSAVDYINLDTNGDFEKVYFRQEYNQDLTFYYVYDELSRSSDVPVKSHTSTIHFTEKDRLQYLWSVLEEADVSVGLENILNISHMESMCMCSANQIALMYDEIPARSALEVREDSKTRDRLDKTSFFGSPPGVERKFLNASLLLNPFKRYSYDQKIRNYNDNRPWVVYGISSQMMEKTKSSCIRRIRLSNIHMQWKEGEKSSTWIIDPSAKILSGEVHPGKLSDFALYSQGINYRYPLNPKEAMQILILHEFMHASGFAKMRHSEFDDIMAQSIKLLRSRKAYKNDNQNSSLRYIREKSDCTNLLIGFSMQKGTPEMVPDY